MVREGYMDPVYQMFEERDREEVALLRRAKKAQPKEARKESVLEEVTFIATGFIGVVVFTLLAAVLQ